MTLPDHVHKHVALLEPARSLLITGEWRAAESSFAVDHPATGNILGA
jgi:hypothetical protein